MAVFYESYYGVLPSRSDYISHHGIKGQKWYHRRFQNDDGSLTAAGRARYGIGPARKFKTKEERAAAKAEKQEASRQKFSGKMQDKYHLVDIPTNKDAAWDNATDMLNSGASDRELKKYLKLNGLDKKAVSDLMKESKEKREAARDEERKAKRAADLEDAVSKGDASRIMKYANEMSTNDLNNALNRVRYMTQLKELGAPPKKDSVLKKIASLGNDIANAGNAVANASAAVKRVSDLFKTQESEDDKAKGAAYREALKNTAAEDAKEIRKLAKEAGLSTKEANAIAKNRYDQLYNDAEPSKAFKKLFESKVSETADTSSKSSSKSEKKAKNATKEEPKESAFEKYQKWRAEESAKKNSAEDTMLRLLSAGQASKPSSSSTSSALQQIMGSRKEKADAKSQSRQSLENAMSKAVSAGISSTPSRVKDGPINVSALKSKNDTKIASLNRESSASSIISKRATENAARRNMETKLSSIVKSSMSSYPSRTTNPIDLSALKKNNQTKLSDLSSNLPDWLKKK